MEPQTNPLKGAVITLGVALPVLFLSGVGGTYYVMGQKAKKDVSDLEKRIAAFEKNAEVKPVTTPTPTPIEKEALELSDKEQLMVLTVRTIQKEIDNGNYLPAANIRRIDGNWAATTPVPLRPDYTVPGMGGADRIWNKKDGLWRLVGSCGEGGCDDNVKAAYAEIPTTIIPKDAR